MHCDYVLGLAQSLVVWLFVMSRPNYLETLPHPLPQDSTANAHTCRRPHNFTSISREINDNLKKRNKLVSIEIRKQWEWALGSALITREASACADRIKWSAVTHKHTHHTLVLVTNEVVETIYRERLEHRWAQSPPPPHPHQSPGKQIRESYPCVNILSLISIFGVLDYQCVCACVCVCASTYYV